MARVVAGLNQDDVAIRKPRTQRLEKPTRDIAPVILRWLLFHIGPLVYNTTIAANTANPIHGDGIKDQAPTALAHHLMLAAKSRQFIGS